jgi:serine/threonine protein kinase
MRPGSLEASALEPDSMVGEYRVTHKLGEGGMGVVYAAVHPDIGTRVAIKVLAPHAAVYPDLVRRFKEEARSVNKIRHPNIIYIFAFNQLPDGRHYFVMEYLDGESLTARLERGPTEVAEIRRLLRQICSALQAAHDAGVVHRDLKPDNVWVATDAHSESRIKLLDFGIAKLSDVTASKLTQAGVPMGTPQYMPPEQGMGRAIDRRADIYSLGVILYQIFAGTLPFHGATAQEIVFKHVTEPPLWPSRHRPIVPKAMEAIILDCLEKEPEKRPATVKEVAARIEAAFESEAARTGRASVPATLPRMTSPTPIAREAMPSVRALSGKSPSLQPGTTSLTGMAGEANERAPEFRRSSGRSMAIAVGTLAVAAGVGAAASLLHRAPEVAVAQTSHPALAPTPGAAVRVLPQPVAAPPAPPPVPTKAPPTEVQIKIDSLPSGARVVLEPDGAVLGRTPYSGRRPLGDSALNLALEIDGYKSHVVRVPLAADFDQTYELEKNPPAPRSPHHPAKPTHAESPPVLAPPPAAAPAPVAVPIPPSPPAQDRPAAPKKSPDIIEWTIPH